MTREQVIQGRILVEKIDQLSKHLNINGPKIEATPILLKPEIFTEEVQLFNEELQLTWERFANRQLEVLNNQLRKL